MTSDRPTVDEIQREFADGERDPVEDADEYDGDGTTLVFVHEGRDGTVTKAFTPAEADATKVRYTEGE